MDRESPQRPTSPVYDDLLYPVPASCGLTKAYNALAEMEDLLVEDGDMEVAQYNNEVHERFRIYGSNLSTRDWNLVGMRPIMHAQDKCQHYWSFEGLRTETPTISSYMTGPDRRILASLPELHEKEGWKCLTAFFTYMFRTTLAGYDFNVRIDGEKVVNLFSIIVKMEKKNSNRGGYCSLAVSDALPVIVNEMMDYVREKVNELKDKYDLTKEENIYSFRKELNKFKISQEIVSKLANVFEIHQPHKGKKLHFLFINIESLLLLNDMFDSENDGKGTFEITNDNLEVVLDIGNSQFILSNEIYPPTDLLKVDEYENTDFSFIKLKKSKAFLLSYKDSSSEEKVNLRKQTYDKLTKFHPLAYLLQALCITTVNFPDIKCVHSEVANMLFENMNAIASIPKNVESMLPCLLCMCLSPLPPYASIEVVLMLSGPESIVEYHKREVRLGLAFFLCVERNLFNDFVTFFPENMQKKKYCPQSGFNAQVFRALLASYEIQNNIDKYLVFDDVTEMNKYILDMNWNTSYCNSNETEDNEKLRPLYIPKEFISYPNYGKKNNNRQIYNLLVNFFDGKNSNSPLLEAVSRYSGTEDKLYNCIKGKSEMSLKDREFCLYLHCYTAAYIDESLFPFLRLMEDFVKSLIAESMKNYESKRVPSLHYGYNNFNEIHFLIINNILHFITCASPMVCVNINYIPASCYINSLKLMCPYYRNIYQKHLKMIITYLNSKSMLKLLPSNEVTRRGVVTTDDNEIPFTTVLTGRQGFLSMYNVIVSTSGNMLLETPEIDELREEIYQMINKTLSSNSTLFYCLLHLEKARMINYSFDDCCKCAKYSNGLYGRVGKYLNDAENITKEQHVTHEMRLAMIKKRLDHCIRIQKFITDNFSFLTWQLRASPQLSNMIFELLHCNSYLEELTSMYPDEEKVKDLTYSELMRQTPIDFNTSILVSTLYSTRNFGVRIFSLIFLVVSGGCSKTILKTIQPVFYEYIQQLALTNDISVEKMVVIYTNILNLAVADYKDAVKKEKKLMVNPKAKARCIKEYARILSDILSGEFMTKEVREMLGASYNILVTNLHILWKLMHKGDKNNKLDKRVGFLLDIMKQLHGNEDVRNLLPKEEYKEDDHKEEEEEKEEKKEEEEATDTGATDNSQELTIQLKNISTLELGIDYIHIMLTGLGDAVCVARYGSAADLETVAGERDVCGVIQITNFGLPEPVIEASEASETPETPADEHQLTELAETIEKTLRGADEACKLPLTTTSVFTEPLPLCYSDILAQGLAEPEDTCAVCLVCKGTVAISGCRHRLCVSCLTEMAVSTNRCFHAVTCPLCREHVSDIHFVWSEGRKEERE